MATERATGWPAHGDSAVNQPEFGQRLKARRTALRMSQRQLAGNFVTPSYISLLEAGARVPTLDVVVYLARTMDTPLEELLGEEVLKLTVPEEPRKTQLFAQVLARSASDVGDHQQARQFLQQALDAAKADGSQERILEIGLELQDVLRALGDHDGRLALLEELVDLPLTQTTPELQVVIRTDLAAVQRDVGQLRDARRTAHLALNQLSHPGITGTSEHVRLLGVIISVLCEAGEFEQVDPLITEMLDVAQRLNWPGFVGRAHWVASMAYAQMGRPAQAYEHFAQARSVLAFPTMPLIDWLRFCRSAASVLLDIGDDLETANQWLQDAETTSRMLNIPAESATVALLRARYEVAVGDLDSALRRYAELTVEDSPLVGLDLMSGYLGHGNALRQAGDNTRAIEVLRRAVDVCERSGLYQLASQVWRQIDELKNVGG
ncbi:helix-turn-helix domain-containing protein [Paractinoplanes hotanensis]|uniref:Helix-turn-helix domain-containing protein n=1 Tax=Paractinoplanes hotanensis TaxID=2906497 RepID=A0ABT0YAM9_9ACTN|nr:helix-turn-helix domain-containing protein [Actinoplanes hotanensis]MCM4083094.1 helix-turn-helix domain-containing protein [Actinoplanes hotanensis]